MASLGKITELEKSGDPDTTGKGCGPRQSQPCLLHCVLCCSDWNMYSQQPVLGSECCWKQGTARSVVSKGKKTAAPATTLFLFLFIPCWQSSIQDWGEEVEEGAVYHVTLKRVQIQQAANKGARWLGVSRAS